MLLKNPDTPAKSGVTLSRQLLSLELWGPPTLTSVWDCTLLEEAGLGQQHGSLVLTPTMSVIQRPSV